MRDPRSTSPQIGGSGSFNHERTDTEPRIKDAVDELKPCPFCGSEHVFLREYESAWVVSCGSCWAQGAKGRLEVACREWNRRRA